MRISSFIVMLGMFATAMTAAAGQQRPFTVRDSIELSTFVRPLPAFYGDYLPIAHATRSPDGAHYVVATVHGNLASGAREVELRLFDATEMMAYAASTKHKVPEGRVLVRVASKGNRKAIEDWRWSSDSRSVLFCGGDDDEVGRLYRVSIDGGAAVPLSLPGQNVGHFDERAGVVVYLAGHAVLPGDVYQAGGAALKDIQVGIGESLLSLTFPNWGPFLWRSGEQELWRSENDHARPVLSGDGKTPVRLNTTALSLAPDMQSVLVTQFVKHVPKLWEQYRPVLDESYLGFHADTAETEGQENEYRAREYALVNLATGERSTLVHSPLEVLNAFSRELTAPLWSDDSSSVTVMATFPPIEESTMEAGRPVDSCELASINLKSRAFTCISVQPPLERGKHPFGDREQIASLRWDAHSKSYVVHYVTPNNPNSTARKILTLGPQGQWFEKRDNDARDALSVRVEQSFDQPPVLTVQAHDRKPKLLFDPNPQLRDVALGTTALYHWKDDAGNVWTGALLKPPHFIAGRRYPLVVQTHTLDKASFLVDGPSATGFAARPLAGRDIVVLQVDEIYKYSRPSDESEFGAAGYRAAIRQLDHDGIIDPHKVGIIAWSHMGAYTIQALVDDPQTFKAATFAEAAFNSYPEYLNNIDYMGQEREKMFRAQVGPKPFGDGLSQWIKSAAAFHTDRVCTPTLWQVTSPASLVYVWEAYATLRAQNKPVDFLYVRNGNHVLLKPLQRLAVQGMNVDWYDYWLNGRKDPDPAKADQYKRWESMQPLPSCVAAQVEPARPAGG
jgi:dipeptidyl aminopeptidase/acylaminoacyl peptidase